MDDLSPTSTRLQQSRLSISGSTIVEPYSPPGVKGWNSSYNSGTNTPNLSAQPCIRLTGEGLSLKINGNLIEVSSSCDASTLEKGRREEEEDISQRRPSWRSVTAWRRWAKLRRTPIMATFHCLYILILLAPAIVTPTLVWGIVRYKVLDGELAPGLSDAVLAVLGTATCVFNTLLVLAMKGLGLIEAPWAQNMLTAVGVIATLVALRNSINLPLQP